MRHIELLMDERTVSLDVLQDAIVYGTQLPAPPACATELVRGALERPIAAAPFAEGLRSRRAGDVVIVVSDITRPIPYASFLPGILRMIEAAGVAREQILILVATGMHRPSTPDEHRRMFGDEIVRRYRIEDHNAEAPDLVELPVTTQSGARVRLNRRFVEAGFRILTGLVEPHFMAGFSGGRKSVCPGLADLATIRQFHGYRTLSKPLARCAQLADNPCHIEALSAAREAHVDFSLNVIINRQRQVVAAFAGDLEQAHIAACDFAADRLCPRVTRPADVVLTSSGGYPLDATFYQCVKGFVSCLPAVKPGGTIIALGGCREGIGSTEYTQTMRQYANRWQQFLRDIATGDRFTRDQWQFQMHCRTLAKVGQQNLHFITPGLKQETLAELSVTPHALGNADPAQYLGQLLHQHLHPGQTLAILPEGPYCAPVLMSSEG